MISIEPSWPLSGRAGNPDVDRVADLRPQRGLAGRVVERGRYRAAPIDSKGLPAVGRGAQPRSAVAAAWLLAGLRSLRASVHPGARRAGSQGHSRRFERKRRKSDGYHCCGCVETSSISRSSCDSHGLSADALPSSMTPHAMPPQSLNRYPRPTWPTTGLTAGRFRPGFPGPHRALAVGRDRCQPSRCERSSRGGWGDSSLIRGVR